MRLFSKNYRKLNPRKISKKKTAFSLIEVAIVILILGIILVGVVGSKYVIKKARINSAMSLTKSAPINSISNNELWLETSVQNKAFSDDGNSIADGDNITIWKDRSYNQNPRTITVVGNGPTFSNSINFIQALRFSSNSSSDYLQINDASFLNNSDYTIMITEKRMALNDSGAKNYLVGEDGSFAIGYESETSIIQTHGEAASNNNQASVESFSSYSNKPRVITFTHSSINGNRIYVNATLANSDTTANATTHLSGITNLAIGKNYNGEIGEIVIFSRSLKAVEVQEIENYLTNKWNSPNNRDSVSSCTDGIITQNGCVQACLAPTTSEVNGISGTDSIADGNSASYSCNSTAYSGSTPTYSCSSGTLSPTPSASHCADSGCASGYNVNNNACEQQCTINSQTGIVDGTKVDSGSTSLSCNETDYSGTITYSCADGTFTLTSNDCVGVVTCTAPELLNSATDECDNANLFAWYDASDTSTITSSGNLVSSWSDKSDNSNNLSQGNSSYRPTTNSATLNGLNVIDFDGTNDTLQGTLASLGTNPELTIFAVVQYDVMRAANSILVFVGATSTDQGIGFGLHTSNGLNSFQWGSGSSHDGNYITGSYVIHGMTKTSSGNTTYVNGVAKPLNTSGSLSLASSPTIEISLDNFNNYLDGKVAEILIFNRELDSDERDSIETYLNDKWSVY